MLSQLKSIFIFLESKIFARFEFDFSIGLGEV